MHNPAFRAYLESKIMTASPEQLQLMLYEGAIRFAMMAKLALEERDYSKSNDAFERLDAILDELNSGLRPELDEDLCGGIASLYNFCLRKSQQANLRHQTEPLDEALSVLQHLRETWTMVLEKLVEERALASEGRDESLATSATV